MKFTCSVDINLPIDKVIILFRDQNNLKEWQDGFESFEHVSGNPGEAGAKSKLTYRSDKGAFELLETITVMDLPNEMSGLYEHKHITNTMTNRFSSIGNDQTRWIAEIDYIHINSLMIRLIAFFMPGFFKKQTQKWLNQFKVFAES